MHTHLIRLAVTAALVLVLLALLPLAAEALAPIAYDCNKLAQEGVFPYPYCEPLVCTGIGCVSPWIFLPITGGA